MLEKETKKDSKLFNTKYVANLFRRDESSIQKLAKKKVLPYVKKTKDGYQFDLPKTMLAYIYYLQDINESRTKTTEELEKQRLVAEIKLKETKAEKAILDLEESRGKLFDVEVIQAVHTKIALTTKNLLTALPNRLAMDLPNQSTTSERSMIIEKDVNEILHLLSETEFNIDDYNQVVAERNGRSVNNDEEESED